MINFFAAIRLILVMAGVAMLASCGGGSNGQGPVTGQNPPPEPSPPPDPFDTEEFQRNWGLGGINALAAYEDGLSGEGITVAVIDTGIDPQDPEFDDNLSPASKDIIEERGSLYPDSAHGTGVAGVIAAERNDTAIHGVAYNATLLAIRAEKQGPCEDTCSFFDSDLADAVDYAVANGARIINFSLAGDGPNSAQFQTSLEQAVDAGVIITLAAGNDGADSPNGSALFATDPDSDGYAVIVGASDIGGDIAGFSNRPGEAAKDDFLLAPGAFVAVSDLGGGTRTVSGTSFAVPHASGAAALLLENFPGLSGAEVVDILKETAKDLGAVGNDPIYGAGLIDLAAALAPVGEQTTQSVSGASLDMEGTGLSMGPAFGDALSANRAALGSLGQTLFTDRYDRTYVADLSRGVLVGRNHRFNPTMAARQGVYRRGTSGRLPGLGAFRVAYTDRWGALSRSRIASNLVDDPRPRDIAFSFTTPLGPDTAIEVGHGFQPGDPGSGETFSAFRSVAGEASLFGLAREATRLSLHHRLGAKMLVSFDAGTAGAEPVAGEHMGRSFAAGRLRYAVSERLQAGLRLSLLREGNSLLDTLASGALDGIDGAMSGFVTAEIVYRLRDLTLAARASYGRTRVRERDALLHSFSGIESSAFALSAEWALPLPGHSLGLALSQPLRVESGSARLDVPVRRDGGLGNLVYDTHALGLSPTGREIDVELSHSFWRGGPLSLGTSLIYRHDADHIDGVSDVLGLARLRLGL